MSDPQRSLDGYQSQVHEGTDFENPNEGKPALNDSDEYVFRLTKFPHVITQSVLKEKKDGTRTTVKVDKAVCEFVEETHQNIVTAFFRVDSLNFSEDEAFESGVVRFFKKIKQPLVEGEKPVWRDHFVVGMRFRGRVAIGKDAEKKPNGRYFLDIPTCRPILQSDMHPEAAATLPNQNTSATLANAVFLAKGAKDFHEAMAKLEAAKAPKDIVMALFQAHQDGKVEFKDGDIFIIK